MSFFNRYKQMLDIKGGDILGSQKEALKQNILANFTSSPSYYTVSINSSPTPTDVWIVDDSESKEQKVITTKPDEYALNFGDIVKWNGVYWINTIVDNMSDIYYRGVLRRCADSIKWQDENGDIQESPFFIFSTNATIGTNQDRYLTLGSEQRNIAIQNNINTQKIKKGQRFIFDGGRVWSVDSITMLNTGLINLTLKEDQINEATDNIDLRVCDYVEYHYSVTILNGENFSIRANQTLQLNAEVTRNNVVLDEPVLWSSNNPSVASVDNNGLVTAHANGNVIITVKLSEDNTVQDTTNIAIQLDTVDYYSVSIDASPINVNYSKTFTATVVKNGIVDNSKYVQWYLYDKDGVSQPVSASMTMNSTTQCTLKGLSSGYVKLKAVIIGLNPQVYTIEDIQIKSLI